MESIRTVHPDRIEYLNEQRQFHRLDGPAREWNSGEKSWWVNGERHRLDGPAHEHSYGKEWWNNGKRHREDGPAVEHLAGYKEYYLNDIKYSEDQYQTALIKLKLNRLIN